MSCGRDASPLGAAWRLHQLWAPQKNCPSRGGVEGQGQPVWSNSSGRTPKTCSSLFDLKEVVLRQQLWWQLPLRQQQGSGRLGPCAQGTAPWNMMDFLKNLLVSVLGQWSSAHPGPAALGAGA